ncbi:MAG: FMN-binding protein [Sandaracinaceae bacterium]
MTTHLPVLEGPKPASTLAMYRAMVGIGLLCGLFIVTVFVVTRPVIEENRAEALQAAIFEVLPAATTSRTFALHGEELVLAEQPLPDGTPRVYAGYADDGALVGVAVEAAGMGYADVIRILYGYSPDQEAVVGLRVLESRETPGLGDRIAKDPEFLANFEALDASLAPGGAEVDHPIVTVKNGEKDDPWEIDGITGATISSVAIGDMLRESTGRWVPTLRSAEDTLEQGGGA